MERMSLNFHYWLGNQWIEPDVDILVDGVRGYAFRDLKGTGDFDLPRPVTNRIGEAVAVELAALSKRELTPNVIATSNDPRIEAAAKKAKDILQYRMKVLQWPDLRELATLINIICGTSIIKSYWDERYTDLTTIGSPEAVACPDCGVVLSSPTIPKSMAGSVQYGTEGIQDVVSNNPGTEEQVTLSQCPTCPSGSQLVPYDVGPDEAESGQDYFNRPLGLQTPKGNTALEVISPFEIFPQNSGVGITPENCKVWGQASPRDLDWIEERYPERIEEIKPEDPYEMMRYHPILGEWTILGRYNARLDSNIYDNHARVLELHALPNYRYPDGRSIVMVGDVVLENGPLLRKQSQGVDVPRVTYAAARFKLRLGEFWGHGIVDDLISPQNRLNGMDAQTIDARERMSSPNLFVPDDADFTGPEYNDRYGGGKIMRWTPNPLNPQAKPDVFGGVEVPSSLFKEREQTIADMKQIAGPQDVEVGEAPRNITTTSGLQLLGEAAERRRAPRERSLVSMFERIWEHQLKLLWVLRTESDSYETENSEGDWETQEYDRQVIQGQTKVQVEKQAYVDRSLYIREATREAQADQLYRLDSQLAIKKILEYRGLPTDVNEDLNRQVDIGKRQYVDFTDDGVIPTIDTSIDDFLIRFQTLGTMLLTEEGKRIEARAGWPQITKLIAGWEDQYTQMEMLDMQTKAFYGGTPPPEQANKMYAQGMQQYQQQQDSAQEMVQQTGDASTLPPPGPPPPPPVFLPAAIEDRILMIWTSLIEKGGGLMTIQPPDPAFAQEFLKFRAVVDAYKRYDMKKQMQMMGGMPGMPAPSGTPGSEPVPNMPPGQGNMGFMSPPNAQNPPNPATVPGRKGERAGSG